MRATRRQQLLEELDAIIRTLTAIALAAPSPLLLATGEVSVVLGYMLMHHKTYNMFTDPIFLLLIWAVRMAYVLVRAVFARFFEDSVARLQWSGRKR